MAIDCDLCVSCVERDRFYAVDHLVMRHAFDIHNQLGRFCEERIYQEELLERCKASGLIASREVRLRVSHASFTKCYYMDVVVENGVVYELKATDDLSNGHQTQLINYLLLAGLNYGKIINFRPVSVQSRFVTTTLSSLEKALFKIVDRQWVATDAEEHKIRDVLCELLHEWGPCLEASLYKEALLHFMQGPDAGWLPVPIKVNGRNPGSQNMCLLNPKTAWILSAVHNEGNNYETHLLRLLTHTDLEKMLWFNLNRNEITFKTLVNNSSHS